MTNETSPVQASSPAMSGASAPARTSTSGAAKVFREFKWGLLTLFLLMVVVIGLVYDGGRKKDAVKKADAAKAEASPTPVSQLPAEGLPPGLTDSLANQNAPTMDPGLTSPVVQTPAPPVVQSPPNGNIRTPDISFQPPAYQPPAPIRAIPVVGAEPVRAVGPSVPPVQDASNTGEYMVQPGDTLEGISRKNYPGRTYTGIKAISEANGISDPRRMRAGMKLKIPALPAQQIQRAETHPAPGNVENPPANRQVAEPLTPSTPRTNVQPEEGDVYLVQGGDTLERIARRVLNDGRRWREIYEWNRDQLRDPGVLRVGQKLKIKKDAASSAATPAEASHEPVREQPAQAPRRTVASTEDPVAEEQQNNQPQTIERVEPLQRWMP